MEIGDLNTGNIRTVISDNEYFRWLGDNVVQIFKETKDTKHYTVVF